MSRLKSNIHQCTPELWGPKPRHGFHTKSKGWPLGREWERGLGYGWYKTGCGVVTEDCLHWALSILFVLIICLPKTNKQQRQQQQQTTAPKSLAACIAVLGSASCKAWGSITVLACLFGLGICYFVTYISTRGGGNKLGLDFGGRWNSTRFNCCEFMSVCIDL